MSVQAQIKEYIADQPQAKRSDMEELHRIIVQLMPACKLWFLDGKNSEGKTVSNPNIGYGLQTIKYADGKTREFYQIGLSANTTGISVYILGIADKTYLAQTYGKKLGKANVSGYCIKFKTIKDINMDVLQAAIRYGIEPQDEKMKDISIEKIIRQFIKATNKFDVKAAVALFADDAVIDDVSVGQKFKNTAGVLNYLEKFFVGYHTVTKLESIKVINNYQAKAQVDFTGDFGHETGGLNITINAKGLITLIDAHLD